MIVLAIDQSTVLSGIALLSDGNILAEKMWEENGTRNQQLFPMLSEILKTAGGPQAIDLFAVGLGPGAFSGLRISLSAIRGMAMPDGKPVFGVGSADALAADIMREQTCSGVAVLGDARRGSLWLARFESDGGIPRTAAPLCLIRKEELPAVAAAENIVVTPDWDRIGKDVCALLPAGPRLIQERRTPKAATVGRLALAKLERGLDSEPLRPMYLHPPVFVAPRFPIEPAGDTQPHTT